MIRRLIAILLASASLALFTQISPAGAAPGDYTSFVFARGGNGSLYLRTRLPTGAWTGWRNLGGQITGTPVAELLPGRGLTVFVRGTNGSVYARATTDLVNWGGWQNLGGLIVGSPAVGAATWVTGPGQAQAVLVARGTNGVPYERRLVDGAWQAWTSLGASMASNPTIDVEADEFAFFVYGTQINGQGIERRLGANGLPAAGWRNLGGALLDAPLADGGASDLYTYSRWVDRELVYSQGDGDWFGLGGQLASAPIFGPGSGGSGGPDMLARGLNNAVYGKRFDTGAWVSLGGSTTGTPSGTFIDDGFYFFVARGANGAVWGRTFNAASGTWGAWATLGGSITDSPFIISLIELEIVPGMTYSVSTTSG